MAYGTGSGSIGIGGKLGFGAFGFSYFDGLTRNISIDPTQTDYIQEFQFNFNIGFIQYQHDVQTDLSSGITTKYDAVGLGAIAGIGGGGINSLVMIIVSDITTLQNRGKYQGGLTQDVWCDYVVTNILL